MAAGAAAFSVINLSKPSGFPAADAELVNQGYLNGTRLFVVSSNATYGTHNGRECFIIEAVVRNDYTIQQPPPMDNYLGNATGTAYFGLTAKLYSKSVQIASSDVTNPGAPPLGVPQIGIGSGDTATVEMDIATFSRNVDSYSIDLVMVAGYPIP